MENTSRLPWWEYVLLMTPFAFLAGAFHLASEVAVRHGTPTASCWDKIFIAFVALASVLGGVAAWRRHVGLRLTVAAALLAAAAGFLAARLFGGADAPLGMLYDERHLTFLTGLTALGALGLAFRALWARWLALGLAAAGLLSGLLNSAIVWGVQDCGSAGAELWPHFAFSAWSAALLAVLAGPAVRDALLARSKHAEVWGAQHRLMRVLRPTLVASLVAIPMLLVYAWVQPVVAATVPSAFFLAGVLGLGVLLTVARKAVGAVLLSLGGLGLLAQTVATMSLADTALSFGVATYYAAFWAPAALLSIVCSVLVTRSLASLLRRS